MGIRNKVTGEIYSITSYNPLTSAITGINTTGGNANLGDVANVYIQGGNPGEVLITNGAGNLSWATASTGDAYTRSSFTATAGQTVFAATYTVGYVEVFLNGVLLSTTDYVATNGTSITLATPVAVNDAVDIIAFNTVSIGVASSALVVSNPAQPAITSVGTLTGLTTAGDITADGNIIANTGFFFLGDGGLLSNIGGYGDSNVATYLPTYTGNLDSVGNITSTGNVNASLFIGDGGEISNIAGANVTGQVANALVAGTVYEPAQPNITSVGTLSSLNASGNITTTANIQADYFIGNGSQLTGMYSNANVASYLPTYTGAITSLTGNVTTTANVNAAALSLGTGNLTLSGNLISTTADLITIDPLGDGTSAGNVYIAGSLQVTGNITYNDIVNATTNDLQWVAANNAINPSAASGAGLAVGPLGAYAQFTYNSISNAWQSSLPIIANGGVNANGALSGATTGSFSGAVTASQFIGDGSLLTGLYANANVAAYLPIYDGNILAGNIEVTGRTALGPVGNVSITGGTTGQVLSTNGSGVLDWTTPAGTYANSNVAAYLPTYTGALPSLTGNVTTTANIQADHFIGNGSQLTGVYSNANAASYLPVYTGNLYNVANITASGNVTASYLIGNGSQLTGMYSNANVANYLPIYTGNLDNVDNITASGNISAANVDVNPGGEISFGSGGNMYSIPIGGLAGTVTVNGVNDRGISLTAGGTTPGSSYSQIQWVQDINTYDPFDPAGSITNWVYVQNDGVYIENFDLLNSPGYNHTWKFGTDGVLTAEGNITTPGNITAGFFIGDGGLLSNIATGSDYSNANVANYLPVYTGDLDSVDNIFASGNISVSSGNITVSGSISAGVIIGEGGNISNITGANVSGEVAFATTANSVAGANVSGEVAFAATSNAVAGANVSGEVAFAATANSVAVANVVGIGNIATIDLNGDVTTVLAGDGTFITPAAGSTSNIANGTSNVDIATSDGNITFAVSGNSAGRIGITTVAIGSNAAVAGQGANSIVIGSITGNNIGANSIAIGRSANAQSANSVVINATGANITATNQGVYLAPVRNDTGNTTNTVYYNTTTKEVTYGPAGGGISSSKIANGTSNVEIAQTDGRIRMAVAGTQVANIGLNTLALGAFSGAGIGANSIAIGWNTATGAGYQGSNAIAIGQFAGQGGQRDDSIAMGTRAGNDNQGSSSIAIGPQSGQTNQGNGSVSIGAYAGRQGQGQLSIAIGRGAGNLNQPAQTIILNASGFDYNGVPFQTSSFYVDPVRNDTGNRTNIMHYNPSTREITYAAALASSSIANGTSNVSIAAANGNINIAVNGIKTGTISATSVALGYEAGNTSQGANSVAIGPYAGFNSQGANSVAIGDGAGQTTQGVGAIAIGRAGTTNQQPSAVAIGAYAGLTSQGANAIAIGPYSGGVNQAANSISIGANAQASAAAIVLNASGANLFGTSAGFYVNPVRNDVANTGQVATYNTTSREITYTNTINLAGNITGGNITATGNVSAQNLIVSNDIISPNIGTAAAVDLNGNSSSYLNGIGSWSASTTNVARREITKISDSGIGGILIVADGRLFCIKGGSGGYDIGFNALGASNGADDYANNMFRGVTNCYEIMVGIPTVGVTVVDAGTYCQSAYALLSNGNLYTWGYNNRGQLGLGDLVNRNTPQLSLTGVTKVFTTPSNNTWAGAANGAGTNLTKLIVQKTDGTVWACGYGGQGVLGIGLTPDNYPTWTVLPWIQPFPQSVWNLGNGSYGNMVVQQANGQIWVCGNNASLQLCVGGILTTPVNPAREASGWTGGDNTLILKQVMYGGAYSSNGTGLAAVDTSMWMLLQNATTQRLLQGGSQTYAQGGRGYTGGPSSTAQAADATTGFTGRTAKILAPGAGSQTVYALQTNGDLWTWGRNTYGTAGDGTVTNPVFRPYKVMTGVADIYGDVQGSIVNGFIATAPVVKKTDGTLWSWGYNANGETGCGTGNNNELVPKQIKLSAGIGIGLKAVSTCFSSSVAGSTRFLVTADNQLYVWGNSSTYLLDPVTAGDIYSPLLLNPPILTI